MGGIMTNLMSGGTAGLLVGLVTLSGIMSSGSVAQAGQTDDVLACVGTMKTDADWAICRNLMFAPCATDTGWPRSRRDVRNCPHR